MTILFRGRIHPACDYVEGGLVYIDGRPHIIQLDEHLGVTFFAVDPDTLTIKRGEAEWIRM